MVLDRYVLKEHLIPFFFSFSVIMFLLVIDLILQMIDLILGKMVYKEIVIELFFLNTAWMVALAVPMAVLVSVLMAFGRLSGNGEIIAMGAAGVGLYQIIWPVVLIGALISTGLILFNNWVLPGFNHRARVLMMDIKKKQPAVVLEGKVGVFIEDFKNFRILIGNIDNRTSELQNVVIYKYEPNNFPITIVADRGEVFFFEGSDEVQLTLYNGEIHRVDDTDPEIYIKALFEKQNLRLGDAGRRFSRTVSQYRTDREMDVGMMLSQVSNFEQEIRILRNETSDRIKRFFRRYLVNISPKDPISRREFQELLSRVRADEKILEHKQKGVNRYLVEIHKKFSIPAACLAFILVGAPLGIKIRKNNSALGAGISIIFFLIYWLFLIGGEKLADQGIVAPWFAMWSPNILVALWGGWIYGRMMIYQGILSKVSK